MKYLNRIALLGFLFLVLGFTSCKKDQTKSNPDLSNVEGISMGKIHLSFRPGLGRC